MLKQDAGGGKDTASEYGTDRRALPLGGELSGEAGQGMNIPA